MANSESSDFKRPKFGEAGETKHCAQRKQDDIGEQRAARCLNGRILNGHGFVRIIKLLSIVLVGAIRINIVCATGFFIRIFFGQGPGHDLGSRLSVASRRAVAAVAIAYLLLVVAHG